MGIDITKDIIGYESSPFQMYESKLLFNKMPRLFICILKFENATLSIVVVTMIRCDCAIE